MKKILKCMPILVILLLAFGNSGFCSIPISEDQGDVMPVYSEDPWTMPQAAFDGIDLPGEDPPLPTVGVISDLLSLGMASTAMCYADLTNNLADNQESLDVDPTGGVTENGAVAETQQFVLDAQAPYGTAQEATVTSEGEHRWGEEQWKPVVDEDMPTNIGEPRSAEAYSEIIEYFNVADQHNLRYQHTETETWCTIFVWDVTSAMGAEIPHWVEGQEMSANDTYEWLEDSGSQYGWTLVSAEEAQEFANQGYPVVAVQYNNSGSGHIAMVIPGEGQTINDVFYPNSAQAGLLNFVGQSTYTGFGTYNPNPILYYVNTSAGGYTFVPPQNNNP